MTTPDIIQALYHHLKQFIQTHAPHTLKIHINTTSGILKIEDLYTFATQIYITYSPELELERISIRVNNVNNPSLAAAVQVQSVMAREMITSLELDITDPQLIEKLEQAIIKLHIYYSAKILPIKI
jgi:hypothetical protein